MKYFENLPKKTFESTIGNFDISDFFTYVDYSELNLNTSTVEIDSKSTLLEASYNVYDDPNAFWIFLVSNKTINPFTLLATNINLFVTDNENKIDMTLVSSPSGSTGLAFSEGSIVVPYIANTGSSGSYSSVGNFNLDGPFTLIENTHFYDASMIIKEQQGNTFISSNGVTSSALIVITPITGGTYSIQKLLYASQTKKAIDAPEKVELSAEGKIEELASSSKYSSSKSSKTSSIEVSTSTSGLTLTTLNVIELSSKRIDAIIQSQVGLLKSYFTSAKYR